MIVHIQKPSILKILDKTRKKQFKGVTYRLYHFCFNIFVAEKHITSTFYLF